MNCLHWKGYLALAILLLSLTGCAACLTLDKAVAGQEKATGLWGELVDGEAFGQSFVSAQDNLYRIDLSTATYARTNSAPVVFHLQTAPGLRTEVLSVTIPGPDVQNERPTTIVFPPLTDSRGKEYFFYIESLGAVPGNAITVYANANDQYAGGTAYRNGQPVDGDLAFTAYSRQAFTLSGVLGDFFSRVSQDVPFFAVYGALIVAVCVRLVVAWRNARWCGG